MAEKIAYEKHPVSPERKKELRSQGYKILDARFAPAELKQDDLDLSAKDAVALIAEMTDKEKISAYLEDDRKTVKAAAEKRLAELH